MNSLFADYVTSGAFTISLSRHQVASLGMAQGGARWINSGGALQRKGLVECVPAPKPLDERGVEFRPTRAGLLCLGMLTEAGLNNGVEDPMALEFAHMRAEVDALRQAASDARLTAQSAMARKGELEAELENARREISRLKTGEDRKLFMPTVRLRDPLPDLSDAAILARAGDA